MFSHSAFTADHVEYQEIYPLSKKVLQRGKPLPFCTGKERGIIFWYLRLFYCFLWFANVNVICSLHSFNVCRPVSQPFISSSDQAQPMVALLCVPDLQPPNVFAIPSIFSCQLYIRNHHIQPKYKPPSRPLNRSLTFPVASVDPIRSFKRGHCVHHTAFNRCWRKESMCRHEKSGRIRSNASFFGDKKKMAGLFSRNFGPNGLKHSPFLLLVLFGAF